MREGAGIWRGEVPRERKDCQVEASTGGYLASSHVLYCVLTNIL